MSTLTGPAPTIDRDRWGRPMIRPKPGAKPVAYTRATTIASTLDDSFGLTRWKQRMTAVGLSKRRDLLTAVAASSLDDKAGLDALCEQAMEAAGASAAATTGTALHAFTERIDRGMDLGDVPDEYAADLDAYRARAAEAGWTVKGVEVFTVNHTHRIAGTADRVVEIDGVRYIADVKTGSTLDHPHAFAAQLAIYSRSLPYDVEAGHTVPWDRVPDQSRGLVIWLPAGQGRCELRWIDLDAGWKAVSVAMWVREWRARKDLLAPFEPPDPILAAIAAAASVEELTSIWALNEAQWTDEHTAAAAARKASLTATAA